MELGRARRRAWSYQRDGLPQTPDESIQIGVRKKEGVVKPENNILYK